MSLVRTSRARDGAKPIIFSAPMVQALLAGRKTQARWLLKPQPPAWANFCEQPEMFNILHQWVPSGLWRWAELEQTPPRALRSWPVDADGSHYWLRLHYAVGDRLWVRETWSHAGTGVWTVAAARMCGRDGVVYRADRDEAGAKYWPSIHMPREFSRLTLIVTDVRVERLQDISEEDARAEGVQQAPGGWWSGAEGQAGTTPRAAYGVLWNSLHGAEAWAANPWVAAISFTAERCNIDAIRQAA